MPIYEYECKACGLFFEEMQGFNDKPIKKCPKCKKKKVYKLISLSAFHLQGTGWYETDYGKKRVSSGTTSLKKSDKVDVGVNAGVDQTVTSGTPDGDSGPSAMESIKKDTAKAKGSK